MSTSHPLSASDKQRISLVLLGLANATARIVDECQLTKPFVESTAHAWYSTANRMQAFPHVMQGFLHIEFAMLSGADHLRALNTLLRADPLLTSSTATLTRGALEAFAKSWYFAMAGDAEVFLFRYPPSRYAEYKYPRRFNESLRTYDGRTLDPEKEAEEVLSELDRLQLGRPERVDITARVAALVDAAHEGDHGRKDYSGLSSVAHAEHIGLGNFLSFDEESGRASLVHRRDIVLDMVSSTCLCVLEALQAVVQIFGSRPRPVAILEQASERALAALLRLFEAEAGVVGDPGTSHR